MLIKAIFTNSVGILISRILGFFRDLLTASILGANIYSDIFFVAFKLPNLFRRIFAEGAFTQTFLPSFINSGYKSAFATKIFIRFVMIIFLISIIITIFAPIATKLIAFGFSDEIITIASKFVAINFYYLDFIFIVTFLGTLLQYKNHFATTAFSTALLNLSLITALLISQHLEKIEIIEYLSYSVLVGGFLQVLIHIFVLKKLNLCKIFTVGFKSTKTKASKIKNDIKRFNKNFFPAIIGNSTAQISAFIDTYLASFLASGTISYLYYANRIFQLPLALFAIAISTALFPTIAKAIKLKDETKAKKYLKNSFWILLFLLSISSVGGIMLSSEITWLLFERGEFVRNDTINTSIILSMYLIGLIPFGLAKIFSLWLYSNHKQLISAKISSISLIFNIILSLVLIYPFGGIGLALASSLSGFVLFWLTVKEFGKENFLNIIYDKKKILLLLLLLGVEVGIIYIFLKFFSI